MRSRLFHRRAAGERDFPGNDIVQRASKGVNIPKRNRVGGAFDLVRGQIVRRTDDFPGARVVFPPDLRCQPEVRQFGYSVGRNENVAGLDVSMNEPLFVRVLQRHRRLRQNAGSGLHRQRPPVANELAEVLAWHVLADQIANPAVFASV